MPADDAAGDDDVLAGAHARGEEVGCLLAEEPELDELVQGAGVESEAADRADHVPVRGDGRDRRGEPRAVGQPRLDPGGDPVEAFPFDLLEQAFEERADLAVVVRRRHRARVRSAARVAEDALWRVDHPLLRVGVGEHPLGDRAEADEVVAQRARERRTVVLGKLDRWRR